MADQDYATVSGTKVHRSDFAYTPAGSKPSEWKLPIHDAGHVRNALARFAQADLPAAAKAAVLAKIHAAAKKFGVHYEGESEKSSDLGMAGLVNLFDKRLRLSLEDPQEVDGVELHEIEVAPTGSWVKGGRKFSIAAEDLDRMVANFAKRKNGEVVIDYEHASEQPEVARGGPVPASGWFRKLWRDGEVLKALVEWTAEAKNFIRQGAYRFFSPAIDWGAKDKETGEPQGATLTSGALTNHPFLEELPALSLSDRDLENPQTSKAMSAPPSGVGAAGTPPEHESASGGKEKLNMAAKKLSMKNSAEGKHQVFDGDDMVGEMEDSHLKTYAKNHLGMVPGDTTPGDGDGDDNPKVKGSELEELKRLATIGRASESADRAEAARKLLLTEAVKEGKLDNLKASELARSGKITLADYISIQEAEKALDAAVQSGKILPRDRQFFFSDALERPQEFKAYVEKASPVVRLDSVGLGSTEAGGVDQEVQLEVKRVQASDKSLKYGAALKQVFRANPELERRYREEHTKRIGEDSAPVVQ